MKIAIAEIQQDQLVSDLSVSIGSKVSGGATLEGRTNSLSIFNSNIALAKANIFGFTNTSVNGTASSSTISGTIDGTGFSISSSSSAAVSG